MTGLGDERMRCAAYPLPPVVPPAGATTPLPPHIQGAERWTERRARITGSRWGLRVLVVGGIAGAAWLLTGAAAHAADRGDEPSGSLLGSVVGGDVTAPVSGLLNAVAQPLEAAPVHHKHHVVADVLEVPQRVLARPVETVNEVVHNTGGIAVNTVTVRPDVAEPLRLTGGTAATAHQRLTTVTDLVTTDAEPVDERSQRPAVTPVQTAAAQAEPAASTSPARIAQALPAPAVILATSRPARRFKAAFVTFAHRHQVLYRAMAATAKSSEDSPGGDGSAPLQLHLGDVSGNPASGSGAPTEGGSAAFLPAAIASSTTACRLLPIASDVEVRRNDAEAPTVSPD